MYQYDKFDFRIIVAFWNVCGFIGLAVVIL